MAKKNIEEMCLALAEETTQGSINDLLTLLKKSDDIKRSEVSNNIDFLLETWDETIGQDVNKADFCIQLAKLTPNDTTLFRNALGVAIKFLLPPNLAKPAIIKALQIRHLETSLHDVLIRFNNLLHLRSGVYAYHYKTGKWGSISDVDEFSGVVMLGELESIKDYMQPLDLLLGSVRFFKCAPKLRKMLENIKKPLIKSNKFKDILEKNCFGLDKSEFTKEIMFNYYVPNTIKPEYFDNWFDHKDKSVVKKKAKIMLRKPSQGRSLKEINILLKEQENDYHIGEDNDIDSFSKFFEDLSENVIVDESKLLIDTLSMLHGPDEILQNIVVPLKGKAPFWPLNFEDLHLEDFDAWTKIPVKKLPQFVNITKILFSEEYLAQLAMILPARCLNPICNVISEELIKSKLDLTIRIDSDILKWIWSNRAKKAKNMIHYLTVDNVILSISTVDVPSAWIVAQRELKKVLFENEKFQKEIIKNTEDISIVIDALLKSKSFFPDEQQSLLVKLSRFSPKLKKMLETGGAELLSRGLKSNKNKKQIVIREFITSPASHKARFEELDNIIKKEMPENVKAIAHAREFGDLKENSEYKAAKERQGFLGGRRSTLEKEISEIKVVDLGKVEVSTVIVVGCSVTVEKTKKKKTEIFHIVGAWDGDPDNDLISYETKLGEILLDKTVGEKVVFPNKDEVEIIKIEKLSDEIIKNLNKH